MSPPAPDVSSAGRRGCSRPTLNADIIDNGVVKADTGYILSTGGVMVAVALGQVVAAITAVYFGSRTCSRSPACPAWRCCGSAAT